MSPQSFGPDINAEHHLSGHSLRDLAGFDFASIVQHGNWHDLLSKLSHQTTSPRDFAGSQKHVPNQRVAVGLRSGNGLLADLRNAGVRRPVCGERFRLRKGRVISKSNREQTDEVIALRVLSFGLDRLIPRPRTPAGHLERRAEQHRLPLTAWDVQLAQQLGDGCLGGVWKPRNERSESGQAEDFDSPIQLSA